MSQDVYFTAQNVVNGRATVARGAGVPDHTPDDWSHSQAIPSGDAYAHLQKYESLFIYHGGTDGSGAWEH